MSLTAEEIRIKLGLDDKELDEGTRRALASLAKLGKQSKATWYEHGEKPARAFKKAIHEITDELPLLGGAARVVLSPIGGTIALATTAAMHFKKVLEEINERLEKIGKSNAEAIGNVRNATRAAARGNSADRERAREEDPGGDSIADLMANAKTADQRQSLLGEILRRRAATERRVVGYNSNFKGRDNARLRIAKADEQLKSIAKQLADAESQMPGIEAAEKSALANMPQPQATFGPHGWEMTKPEIPQAVHDAESMRSKIERFKDAIQHESDTREDLKEKLDEEAKAHDKEVQTLTKLDAARNELLSQIKAQKQLQAVYNQQIGVALRKEEEARQAPYTPGLQEMAGYRGPGGALAREALAAREFAKRQLALATPADLASMRTHAAEAFSDLRTDLHGATTAAGRNRAFRNYGERITGLLNGRISPERALEGIHEEIKSLNLKASGEGLKIQGTE